MSPVYYYERDPSDDLARDPSDGFAREQVGIRTRIIAYQWFLIAAQWALFVVLWLIHIGVL
jgi:hypothetical protein